MLWRLLPPCATSDATWRYPGSLRRAGPPKSSSNPRDKKYSNKVTLIKLQIYNYGELSRALGIQCKSDGWKLRAEQNTDKRTDIGTSNSILAISA